MIKTKKISAGFYQGTYNGIEFTITKCELPTSEVAWYWQIGNQQVHDWYSTKQIAIKAFKSYIDEL